MSNLTVKCYICYKDHLAEIRPFMIGDTFINTYKPNNFIEVNGQSFEDLKDFPELVEVLKNNGLKKLPNPSIQTLPTKSEVDKLVEDFCSIDTKKHFFRQFMNDEISCDEYHRLVDDEGLISYHWKPSGKRNVVFDKSCPEEFKNQYLGLPYTDGKLKYTDYPDRTHFKKKENLLSKVVKWCLN